MSSSAASPTSSRSSASGRLRGVVEVLGGDLGGHADDVFRRCLAVLFCHLTRELAPRADRDYAGEYGTRRLFSPGVQLTPSARDQVTDLAATLAADHGSPGDILTRVYEDALRFRPSTSPGGHIRLTLNREGRKATGSFFTPRPTARLVVAAALLPLGERRPPVVLDPAMGTGVFLRETVRRLARLGMDPAGAAASCLVGFDRDPLAVELAVVSLWLETGARPVDLDRHLRCRDLLAGDPPRRGFDAVIGNPPWGAAVDPAERARLLARYPYLTPAGFDTFKPFLDVAARVTRGTIGMIVPGAMLAQTNHADIRRRLLDSLAPYAAIDLGDRIFMPAAAPACALIFGPRPGPAAVRVAGLARHRQEDAPLPWRTVPASRWSDRGFPLAGDGCVDLLHRLTGQYPALGTLSAFYRVRDGGINYNRAAIARRSLYVAPAPDDPRDCPRYRGRDFARYTPVVRGGWLRHDVERTLLPGERFSLSQALRRLPEKIVLRQTADRLVATLDTTRMAMGRSVIAITAEADVSLQALLACLNSRLLTLLYRTLAGEEGRILPQVKVGRIHQLPVPPVCREPPVTGDAGGGADRDAWNQLHDLAGQLLNNGGPDERIEAAVDRVVYTLYRLTPDEIALVETSINAYRS